MRVFTKITRLFVATLCMIALLPLGFSKSQEGKEELADETPTAKCKVEVERFFESLSELGEEHIDETEAVESLYLDTVREYISELLEKLEISRKTAMEKDNLDQALRIKTLIDEYATLLDSDIVPEPKRSKAKSAAELLFETNLRQAKRKFELEKKRLTSELLKNGNQLRDDSVKTIESLRMEAMKDDAVEDAVAIREQINALKSLDLSKPLVTSGDENIPEQPPQSKNAKEIGKILVVMNPIANTTNTVEVAIPLDAKKVEISFFSSDSQDSFKYKYPGFRGKLTVNGKTIVNYTKKYRWTDGKQYATTSSFDGSEINSRYPDSTLGAFDITNLVTPGKVTTITYGNLQSYARGVRLYIYE